MPANQLDLFAPASAWPAGFRHWDGAIPREEISRFRCYPDLNHAHYGTDDC
jgi:hypothetical protein